MKSWGWWAKLFKITRKQWWPYYLWWVRQTRCSTKGHKRPGWPINMPHHQQKGMHAGGDNTRRGSTDGRTGDLDDVWSRKPHRRKQDPPKTTVQLPRGGPQWNSIRLQHPKQIVTETSCRPVNDSLEGKRMPLDSGQCSSGTPGVTYCKKKVGVARWSPGKGMVVDDPWPRSKVITVRKIQQPDAATGGSLGFSDLEQIQQWHHAVKDARCIQHTCKAAGGLQKVFRWHW